MMGLINFQHGKKRFEVLQLSDFDAVYSLIRRCAEEMWRNGLDQWNPDYPNIETFKAALLANCVYGFYEGNDLVGTVTLDHNQSELYKHVKWTITGNKIGVIHWLAVDPKHQGKGIGKEIMQTIHQIAKTNTLDVLRLDAYCKNLKILKMYEGLGYSRCGEIFIYEDKPGFICFEKQL